MSSPSLSRQIAEAYWSQLRTWKSHDAAVDWMEQFVSDMGVARLASEVESLTGALEAVVARSNQQGDRLQEYEEYEYPPEVDA